MDLEMEDLSSQGPDASIAQKLKKPEVAPASHLGNSDNIEGSVGSVDPLKKSTSESIYNVNSSNSDLSYHDNTEDADDVCDDLDDDDEYVSDYYDDDDDFMYEDNYSKMQAQFDNVDLPTGVEVSLPWLKGPAPADNKPAATSTSSFGDLAESSSSVPLSTASSSSVLASSLSASASSLSASASSSSASASSSSASAGLQSDVKADVGENGVTQNSQPFKPFDTVEDFSDHHYSRMGFSDEQPPKNWAKRIQDEWKILEKNLPDTIFVRVYESRMELLRAVIIGPQGTPYHDGLFVFDCLFPTNYPDAPPMVYYYSGGLRLNPNLYECGKVCLSLLGTWSGKQTEMWIPGKSTMLQVLVSIQALILNAEPFYNEPGYEKSYSGPDGDMRSNKYSEDAFVLSLKTMIYTIRKPPKHFEEFVAGHFRNRACDILIACKAYTEGARVGSVVKGENQGSAGAKCTNEFRSTVAKMMNMLVTYFTKNGSTDCEQFRIAA